jgi:uncharacterized protein
MLFQETAAGIVFAVKVTPRAKTSQLLGWRDNSLCLRLAALPAKGEANEELERYIASLLGLSRSHVRVIQGHTSRQKRLCVSGISLSKLEGILK